MFLAKRMDLLGFGVAAALTASLHHHGEPGDVAAIVSDFDGKDHMKHHILSPTVIF